MTQLRHASIAHKAATVARNAILIIAILCVTWAGHSTANDMADASDLPKGH
ncbi:hypothetical protein GGR95_002936 [Sulfitobacter undariae]|uniref:Uncharacterized protein n=1 Tax=Sulfitobacter undariae TaxID=1563671 RepID=A0A7W6H0U1_9RHOB|nr:hypothetical protein [Sulfitobacter undariae]MBB3995281.1 hypothetical protein [Sulfitobacter undariae]